MTGAVTGDAALTSPSAGRNRDPILSVLTRVLPRSGLVLEIASGSGEHAVWFSGALPALRWQPTDRDPGALASISARRDAADLPNLLPPLALDASSATWPLEGADAVVAINMIHIAPLDALEGLLAGSARILPIGSPLVLYGPFREEGVPLASSNEAFDASLRARDPGWGLRELADVASRAAIHGFRLADRTAMPANNLTVVFRRE